MFKRKIEDRIVPVVTDFDNSVIAGDEPEYEEPNLDNVTWEKTLKYIPDGVQTLSKMPSKHVEGIYPKYIDRADGAYVYAGEEEYIDYPCGLGSILLGYNYPSVNEAIVHQLGKGIIYSLPAKLETILAEKICQLIPCAEKVRFLKSGTEATASAIRIARASTGKDGIVFCGYMGQHDNYVSTTPKNKGVPTMLTSICAQVKYGDKEAMTDIFSMSGSIRKEIAAVIIEPYIYEEPGDYLKWLIEFVHNNNALVIFDEVVTGFRTKGFSAQKMLGVTPDLATFGKAMGNGMPISFVCGKNQYMSELQGDCFVSGTFGGELLSMAAALATIKVLEEEDVINHIWEMGQQLKDGYNKIANGYSRCIGYPCRTFFELNDAQKGLLWENCLTRGVLFGYAQFVNYSHKQEEIDLTLDALDESFKILKQHWDNPIEAMKGKCPVKTVRQFSVKR